MYRLNLLLKALVIPAFNRRVQLPPDSGCCYKKFITSTYYTAKLHNDLNSLAVYSSVAMHAGIVPTKNQVSIAVSLKTRPLGLIALFFKNEILSINLNPTSLSR
jgi:hypothetical protein